MSVKSKSLLCMPPLSWPGAAVGVAMGVLFEGVCTRCTSQEAGGLKGMACSGLTERSAEAARAGGALGAGFAGEVSMLASKAACVLRLISAGLSAVVCPGANKGALGSEEERMLISPVEMSGSLLSTDCWPLVLGEGGWVVPNPGSFNSAPPSMPRGPVPGTLPCAVAPHPASAGAPSLLEAMVWLDSAFMSHLATCLSRPWDWANATKLPGLGAG